MKPHVLIAVDEFTTRNMEFLTAPLGGRATWERIPKAVSPETYRSKIKSADITIGWPDPHWLVESDVRLHLLPSVGYEAYIGIGLEEKTGFRLCNARGVMSIPVAEHFMAMLLGLARRMPQHVRDQAAHHWERQSEYREVAGSTVCIIGLGSIGTEIARRCSGLGMRIIGVDPDPNAGEGLAERVYAPSMLEGVLADADHLVLSFPAGPDFNGFFNAERFSQMKPGACFYNLARGSMVEEPALVDALRSRHLWGAGLDVFNLEPLPSDSHLWELDNCIITPHSGGRSIQEFIRMAQLFAENLERYLDDKPLKNQVQLG